MSNISKEKEEKTEDGLNRERRTILKIFCAQIACGALFAVGGYFTARENTAKKGVLIDKLPEANAWVVADPMVCVGCRTCEMVCPMAHGDGCWPARARLHVMEDLSERFEKVYVLPEVCRQCNDAECIRACVFDAAIIDRNTKARNIDPAKCVGCFRCAKACPWGMITIDEEKKKAIKCDLCDGDPQCVKYCPAGALKYVQLF